MISDDIENTDNPKSQKKLSFFLDRCYRYNTDHVTQKLAADWSQLRRWIPVLELPAEYHPIM